MHVVAHDYGYTLSAGYDDDILLRKHLKIVASVLHKDARR